MPITLVTDTDVAAIPFAADPKYSFRIDPENKGPFAGMLPLSHVLDPAREKECIDQLAGQFKAIPYEYMREYYLRSTGVRYIVNSLDAAYQNAVNPKAAEMLLTEKLSMGGKTGDPVANAIQRQLNKRNVSSLSALMKDFAAEQNIPLTETPVKFMEYLGIAELHPQEWRSLRGEFEATSKRSEITAAGELAKNSEALKFAECFDETERKPLLQAMQHPYNETGMRQGIVDTLYKTLDGSASAPKENLTAGIEQAVKRYNLPHPKSSRISLLGGQSLEYTLENFKAAQAIAASPEEAAVKHFQAMKAAALEGKFVPQIPVAKYESTVSKLFSHCPPAIRNAAEKAHMNVVIAGNGVNIDSIVPNPGGVQFLSKTMGGSTSHGIYISEPMLSQPSVLKEEILHEVESHVLGAKGSFSSQLVWKRAVALDTTQGVSNPVFQHLTGKPIVMDAQKHMSKSNAAISSWSKPLDVASSEPVQFIEALPDIYHFRDAAQQELKKAGKIKINGVTYTTADQVMNAAFPNAWPILEGPGEGMKLVQYADGRVASIALNAQAPTGAEVVTSLHEYCETYSGIKSVSLANDPIAKAAAEEAGALERAETFLRDAEGKIKFGKVTAIVTGVVAVGGAVYYLFHKKKPETPPAEKQPWTARVTESQSQQRSL